MLKNEYRRALIMLRGIARGFAGHARLERRTLMGTLSVIVTQMLSGARLYAALVGRRDNEYFATALNELRQDSRGQAGLLTNFDPRSIDGVELDGYSLLVIVSVTDTVCELVLAGNLNGSTDMDIDRVRAAACALFSQAQTEVAEEQTEVVIEPSETTDTPAAELTDEERAQQEALREELSGLFETQEEAEPAVESVPEAAQEAMDAEWPQELYEIRDMFNALELERIDGISGDYIFVRAPLPVASGYEYSLTGIKVENGQLTSICLALPDRYAAEPPPGLEGYSWVSSGEGGWWVHCRPVEQA